MQLAELADVSNTQASDTVAGVSEKIASVVAAYLDGPSVIVTCWIRAFVNSLARLQD